MKNLAHPMKASIAVVIFLVTIVAFPLIASAHVEISPDTAEQGSSGDFSFGVPNEIITAKTIKVQIQLPPKYPIASVGVGDISGWSHSVKKITLTDPIKDAEGKQVSQVVSEITFEGGAIAREDTEEFHITMGPLSLETDSLVFKVLQTYDNGEIISWIQESQKGGSEPEFPAPILKLTKSETTTSTDKAVVEEPTSAPLSNVPEEKSTDEETSPWLYAAVGLGAAALLIGITALVKVRKSKSKGDQSALPEGDEE